MNQKSWIISVNMGYGHQRTAYPLKGLAFAGKVINANDYPGIPKKEKALWEGARSFYEFISRFKRIPLIGDIAFSIYDTFQKIVVFYPKKDLSKPNLTLKQIYSSIKKGWGRDIISKIKTESEKIKINPPIISTFFTPAFMAEIFGYPGEIFCVVCDADIARTWAPLNPKESRIKYFAPTERVAERLKLYGVKEENIFLTGYPLPLPSARQNFSLPGLENNVEKESIDLLKEDLKFRLLNLDPQKRYFAKYKNFIEENLGGLPELADHPLTIMFSVGGAGAQKEIGVKILKCLRFYIKQGKVKVILSAGIRENIKEYFEKNIKKLDYEPPPCNNAAGPLSSGVEILFEKNIEDYFQKFNSALRKADILWTKPSELSFYSALGIPIIISPTIGSQEEFNMRWLLKSGFGLMQENANYADQWLFDWLKQGYLAEAAMEGFVEGEKLGTLKISRIIHEFERG